jgi:hypothetical protein
MADGLFGALWPVALSSSGNFCVAGTLETPMQVTFGGGLLPGNQGDAGFACYGGADGSYQFSARSLSSSPATVTGLAAHGPPAQGAPSILGVVGSTQGTLSFDGPMVLPPEPQEFLAAFREGGVPLGISGVKDARSSFSQSAARASNQAIVVTGAFSHSISIGGGMLQTNVAGGAAYVSVVPF